MQPSDLLARYATGERDFRGADLADADLADADLAGADLAGADLAGADLAGANLTRAYLAGADLADADLAGADLTRAYLMDADLAGADLAGADLAGAYLMDADLAIEQLRAANLAPIRADVLALCRLMPAEAPGLLSALEDGRVDGWAYAGDCACLVGTLANCRGVDVDELLTLVPGVVIDARRPRERWFLAIGVGDTPATNPISAITAEWLRELIAELGANIASAEASTDA